MTAPHMPNRMHRDHAGDIHAFPLGEVHHVGRHNGSGLSVWFKYGARVDLTPADMRKICREGIAELAKLHFSLADVHDACGGDQ